jgi:ribulose-5-phosphate 4-epimerase/fuculose-1-phosphate aldolase
MEAALASQLCSARDRLRSRRLFPESKASLSVRVPGSQNCLFLDASAESATLQSFVEMCQSDDENPPVHAPGTHAWIYRLRPDIGSIVVGGGTYGALLHKIGSVLPMLFDEQARHLGRMRGPVTRTDGPAFERALADAIGGGANAVVVKGIPIRLGITCQRMVFNSELFEKCAKAFVLASATGTPVTQIPWWVSKIATGRLRKDERNATHSFAQGKLPEESVGY